MDELVDIVDQNDKVIYQELKSIAHQNVLIHRTVHGIVINKYNEIFLTKRSLKKEKGPGLFDASIGGHVLAQESYESAIKREGFEELGIKNGKYIYYGKYFSNTQNMKHMCSIYIVQYDDKIKLDKKEFDSGKWESYEKITILKKGLFTPDYISSLKIVQPFFSAKKTLYFI